MGGETRLNPAVQNIRSGGETVINPALGIAAELPAGTLLPGGYEVVGRLDVRRGKRIFSFAGRTVRTMPRSSTAVR